VHTQELLCLVRTVTYELGVSLMQDTACYCHACSALTASACEELEVHPIHVYNIWPPKCTTKVDWQYAVMLRPATANLSIIEPLHSLQSLYVQSFAGCFMFPAGDVVCKLPIVWACKGGCCGTPHNREFTCSRSKRNAWLVHTVTVPV
jgi:hypothetical protein